MVLEVPGQLVLLDHHYYLLEFPYDHYELQVEKLKLE